MPRQYDVMAAGLVCLDMIPQFLGDGGRSIAEILRPGTLVEMGSLSTSTGGPVSNTGIGLSRLGHQVCFNTLVGEDAFGKLTLELLGQNGSTDGVRIAPGCASSYTVVVAPPGVDRIFLHSPGTNHVYDTDAVDPDLVAQCRVFHFGYPPLMRQLYDNEGAGLVRVFEIAKEAGATTSCDMSLPDRTTPAGQAPWATILERVLPHVDVFLPSIEEAYFMLEPETHARMKEGIGGDEFIDRVVPEDYTRLADKLLGCGAKIVALKSGHRGFYVKTGAKEGFADMGDARPGDAGGWANREVWGPAFHAPDLASATGSGDSSIAGFLNGFLRGLSIEETVSAANAVGWQNVQVLDAVSGIKTWDETLEQLAERKPMNEVHVEQAGWHWNDTFRVWTSPADAG